MLNHAGAPFARRHGAAHGVDMRSRDDADIGDPAIE
jgi:hypothetical protein